MPTNELQPLNLEEDLFINPEISTMPAPEIGAQVMIYKDPMFKETQEGNATVNKILMSDGQRNLCLVTLESNGIQVERWIKKESAL